MLKKILVLGLVVALLAGELAGCIALAHGGGPAWGEKPQLGEAPARPVVYNGTVYTAWGTVLRGLNIMTGNLSEQGEPGGKVAGKEDIAQVPAHGMNSIKLSIFGPEQDPDWLSGGPLYDNNVAYADMVIDWAEELGLYVILCLHTGGDPFQPDFVYGFWRLFADRYKDRTHVIFDIANEMSVYSDPDDAPVDTPELEATAYGIIREIAPDTLCIFWSFSHLIPMEAIFRDIERMESLVPGGIPWTNEVIGFHAYEGANGYYPENDWVHAELFRSELRRLAAAGYPLLNTEVPNTQFGYRGAINLSDYPNAQLLRVLEEEGVGWTSFLDIAWIREASVWRGTVERAGLVWTPDFGEWPAPGLMNPYEPHAALADAAEQHEAYASMSEAESLEVMGNVDMNAIPSLFVSKESWVRYDKLNFGTLEPYSLTVRARGLDDGVTVIAHEGDATGPVLCEIPIRKTPGETASYTAVLTRAISGIQDVTFTFRDREGADNWRVMYFVDWCFNLPPRAPDTACIDIYAGPVAAVHYAFRQSGILRRPSDDPGARSEGGREAKVAGITDGSAILFDRVAFTPGAATFEVRAKALQKGRIDVYANWGFGIRPWPDWTFPLGSCEIDGSAGAWTAYSIPIDAELANSVVYNQYPLHVLDLLLVFTAAEGTGADGEELFEISEFSFIQH